MNEYEIKEDHNCGVHAVEMSYLKKEVQELRAMADILHQLTVQIERLALETKHAREDFNILAKRVAAIENRPIKRYEAVSVSVTSAIVGVIVGIIATTLGLR